MVLAAQSSGIKNGTNARSPKELAALINSAWRKSAEAFIEAGRYLTEAKAELDPDQFNELIEHELDFDASAARKLIGCASKQALCAHVHKLPPHWSTIYELSKLEDNVIDTAVADGKISPKMLRKDAIALRKPESKGAQEAAGAKSINKAQSPNPDLFFAEATGDVLFNRISATRRVEVAAEFLDALAADDAVLKAALAVTRVSLVDLDDWLAGQNATIARDIIDGAGTAKASAIRQHLPDQSTSKLDQAGHDDLGEVLPNEMRGELRDRIFGQWKLTNAAIAALAMECAAMLDDRPDRNRSRIRQKLELIGELAGAEVEAPEDETLEDETPAIEKVATKAIADMKPAESGQRDRGAFNRGMGTAGRATNFRQSR